MLKMTFAIKSKIVTAINIWIDYYLMFNNKNDNLDYEQEKNIVPMCSMLIVE